jgi:hypothetical protein
LVGELVVGRLLMVIRFAFIRFGTGPGPIIAAGA